jgi:hypothetical protein
VSECAFAHPQGSVGRAIDCIGDAAEIKTRRVRKQKTDRQDAQLLLKLMLEDRFPRVWIPDPENRDLRQLLWHRHRLVQMRTRIMNQLQAMAMNEGQRWRKKLWKEWGRAQLAQLQLPPWASRRRQDLTELLFFLVRWNFDKVLPKPNDTATWNEPASIQMFMLMSHWYASIDAGIIDCAQTVGHTNQSGSDNLPIL